MRRSTLAALRLLMLFFSIAAASAQERPLKPINIVYASATTYTTHLWIAHDKGLFEKHGLKPNLIYVQGSAAAAQALIGGSADLAFASGSAALTLAGRGAKVAIIATSGPTDFLLLAHPSIKTAAELKGKSIGVSNFAAGDYFALLRLLPKLGLRPNVDVKFVNMGVPNPNQKAAAIFNRTIDATLGNPETIFAFQKTNQSFSQLGEAIPNGIYVTVGDIFGTKKYVEGHPGEVKGFLRAFCEAIALAKQDKELVFEILRSRMKIEDPNLLEAIFKFRIHGTLPDNPPYPVVDSVRMAAEDLATTSPELRKLRDMNPKDLIDARPLKALESEGFFAKLRR